MSAKPKSIMPEATDDKYELVAAGRYVRRTQPSSGKLTDKQVTDNVRFLLRKVGSTAKREHAETASK